MPYHLNSRYTVDTSNFSEEELWNHYEACLKHHDWTYDMSDDGGVWRAGREASAYIKNIKERLDETDKDRSDKLYWKHNFWLNDDGTRKKF